MRFLTDKELERVSKLDAAQQHRFETCIHEAGHAILALLCPGATFDRIFVNAYNAANLEAGGLAGLTLPDGHTIRQDVLISLGGWAAIEVFCGVPVDFLFHPGFMSDRRDIKDALRGQKFEAVLIVTQPQAKGMLMANIKEIKTIAFKLFETGSLTFREVSQLIYYGMVVD
jgi:hypothetical protein